MKGAKTAGNSDKDFNEYAATHGITTLEGGGESPEVTADGLRFEAVTKDAPVKLDGVLGEWPASAKATVVKGSTKSALKIGLQYDASKIYVGADVTDASFAPGKDYVSIVLAVPTPSGSYATYELSFYPGKPGETEGSVRYARRGAVPGAKIVEAPNAGGYTFEASLPWSAVPEARTTKVGIHGVAAYVDSDGTVATGPGDAQHARDMPWVPSESELSMIEQLLQPKGLTKRAPDVELVADLIGDGNHERVAVWEQYLTVCGASYLGGTGFFFRDLSGELVKLEVRDATGRGKGDLVVRRKQSVGDGTREYLEILSGASAAEEPRVAFAHEISIRQSDKHVDNSVHIGRGAIDVSIEPATNWDASSYSEPIASDVEPLLLPWGTVKSQTFKYESGKFSKTKEVAQAGQESWAFGVRPRKRAGADTTCRSRRRRKLVHGGDLSGQLLDQYRKDRQRPGGGRPEDGPPGPRRGRWASRAGRPHRPGRRGLWPGLQRRQRLHLPHAAAVLGPRRHQGPLACDLTGDGAADLAVRGCATSTATPARSIPR